MANFYRLRRVLLSSPTLLMYSTIAPSLSLHVVSGEIDDVINERRPRGDPEDNRRGVNCEQYDAIIPPFQRVCSVAGFSTAQVSYIRPEPSHCKALENRD